MDKGILRNKIRLIDLTLFFITFLLTGFVLLIFSLNWWLCIILIPVMLLGWHFNKELGTSRRVMLQGLYSGIIIQGILKIIHIIAAGFTNPPEWDFLTIWLNGRIATQGLNFYNPTNYLNYDLPIKISPDFTSEFLKVGFGFPPTTILLFYPLGWFKSINYAYLSWQVLMTVIIGLSIYLLWKQYMEKEAWSALFVTGALVLLFPGTYNTLNYAQTNFIVLTGLLIYIYYSEYLSGGIGLAIGFLVKPYVAIFFLFTMIRRQWRVLMGSIITYGFLSIITVLVIGFTRFSSFFVEKPISKLPASVYSENVNQSLLAIILRLTNWDFSGKSPLFNPIFILLTVVLLAISTLLTFFVKKEDSIWVIALTLLTALLIYPGTLFHYSVLLILPIFVLWKYRNAVPQGLIVSVLVITVTYLFILKAGDFTFLAITLNWFVFTVICSWKVLNQYRDSRLAGNKSNML